MKSYLHLIDKNTTKNRNDVTPLFSHYKGFDSLVNDLVQPLKGKKIDLVACIDALGFILGTAIALKLKVGILPVRKKNKLPVKVDRMCFTDYTGKKKGLEIRQDIITQGTKILIVDEWIETGAQVAAAINLIEKRRGIVVGISTINIDDNESTRKITSKYNVYSVWEE
ncbi:MAG: adenine phosphoribosyltransferase [bacterium]|nr:adenine phosphoribosyltransferase [bacterium]